MEITVLNIWSTLISPSCLQFYLLFYQFHPVLSDFFIKNRPRKVFEIPGDIKLGALMPMSKHRPTEYVCSDELNIPSVIHFVAAMEYAVLQVNKRKLFPRNLTLGLVVLDDCYSNREVLLQAVTFLPQTCSSENRSQTQDVVKAFDVVGVIGPSTDQQAELVVDLYLNAEVPVVSFIVNGDDMTNKKDYPYFFTTAAPERKLIKTFTSFAQLNNWTYISLVHENDKEGFARESYFQKHTEDVLCVATTLAVEVWFNNEQFDAVVDKLWKVMSARVVVLLTSAEIIVKVISAVNRNTNIPKGHFVWVHLGGWTGETETMAELGDLLWGSLVINQFYDPTPEYDSYFRLLSLNATKNPWFPDFWKKYFKCNDSCESYTLSSYMYNTYAGRIIETVNIFARAIAQILKSTKCSGRIDIAKDRECITGYLLREALNNDPRLNIYDNVQFNESDDVKLHLVSEIHQVMPANETMRKAGVTYGEVVLFSFNHRTNIPKILSAPIWSYHWLPSSKMSLESICSVPCSEHHAVIKLEISCCFECHPCRVNEFLTENGSQCERCPEFTWPDPDTQNTTCKNIIPDVPSLTNMTGVAQIVLVSVFTVCCLTVFVFFCRHSNTRIIKASSFVLSNCMLLAILIGNMTILMLSSYPTEVLCRLIYLCVCLSFSILYGALLTRAFIIYRIFSNSLKSARRQGLQIRTHKILLFTGFVLMQFLLCLEVLDVNQTWAYRTMTESLVPDVEMSCHFPVIGMALFLIYNSLVMAVCTYLAFVTRKLPSNFNESRCIVLCVSTTMVLWLAFVPSYVATLRALVQIQIISAALILNNPVALAFIFLPKIYAILCFEDRANSMHLSMRSADKYIVYTVASKGSDDKRISGKKKDFSDTETAHETISILSVQSDFEHTGSFRHKLTAITEEKYETRVSLTDTEISDVDKRIWTVQDNVTNDSLKNAEWQSSFPNVQKNLSDVILTANIEKSETNVIREETSGDWSDYGPSESEVN